MTAPPDTAQLAGLLVVIALVLALRWFIDWLRRVDAQRSVCRQHIQCMPLRNDPATPVYQCTPYDWGNDE